MQFVRTLGSLAVCLVLAHTAYATRITFDGAASGNNVDLPLHYGSFVTGDATGFITTDGSGTTPQIGLTWLGNLEDEWEFHTATTWVHESPVAVVQMDHNRDSPFDDVAEVVFAPIDGRSVVINSFLLTGATDQRDDANYDWEVVGTSFSGSQVVGVGANTGNVQVGFTGQPGVAYTLRFTRQPGQDSAFGTALDDLSFSQTLLPSAEVLKLTVDRVTGNLTLHNIGTNPANLIGYSITSAAGALNPTNWTTIKNNYDVNGNKSVDANDAWTVLPQQPVNTQLTEFQFGGNGGTIAPAAAVNLGNTWIRSPAEDLKLELVLSDNRVNRYSVEYVNGPAGGYVTGDLNFDGQINALDWPIYNAGRGVDLSQLSPPASYQQGDLDGDRDNDIVDFLLFKSLFVAANGAAAFAALQAVPEPSTAMLSLIGGLWIVRRRAPLGRRAASVSGRCSKLTRGVAARWAGACACLAVLVSAANATTITFSGNPTNNADIPEFYGSNIAADEPGFVTTDGTGATPHIALTWFPAGSTGANVWEFHSASTFSGSGFDVPVAQLDVDGSAQPANTPPPDPTIDFTVGATVAFQLHSFQIGNATDQSEPPYGWTINLIRLSDQAVVQSRSTSLLSAGSLETINFDFLGDIGEDYRLHFDDGGANRVRSAIDNLSFSETMLTPSRLKIIVNTTTGAVTLANDTGQGLDIDSYEIRSASNSLNPGGWSSLQEQDFEGNGLPGTGNGWEEAGGVGAHQLIESYLLGDSTIAQGAEVTLGNAFDFDRTGVQQDLQFFYHLAGGGAFLTAGDVQYISPVIDADFDNDGDVDGRDFLRWQRGVGLSGSATNAQGDADGDLDVDRQDLAAWESRFGTSGNAAASLSVVPEPGGVGLVVLTLVALTGHGRRPRARDVKGNPLHNPVPDDSRLVPTRAIKGLPFAAAAVIGLFLVQSAMAAKTVDRWYRFGEHPSEPAVAGNVVGGSGETLDSVSQTGSRFDSDAQNLTPNSPTLGPKYANVGPTGLARPGATAGQFGAQFDGVDDVLSGIGLNRPDETAGPSFTGIGPLLFPFPFNYDQITARGLQMWVYPDASALGTGRQGIVFDTQAAGGVSITADGKWTQSNDSKVADGQIPATVSVVGNQWYHVMHHIYPSSHPGAPHPVADGPPFEQGFTAVVYVNGIAVSANNGFPSPGELDNGSRAGVLAVGAEEIPGDGFTPEFANHFRGVVDDLEMYVFGDNTGISTSPPPGMNYGAFELFADNAWIASQIALLPGGDLNPGDVNRDGSVSQADVTALAMGWGREKRLAGSLGVLNVGDWETWGWGDLNLDGLVNLHDAIRLNDALIAAGGGALDFSLLGGSGVPEPGTMLLALMAWFATGRNRRHAARCATSK
jgi:hypothetical protein